MVVKLRKEKEADEKRKEEMRREADALKLREEEMRKEKEAEDRRRRDLEELARRFLLFAFLNLKRKKIIE